MAKAKRPSKLNPRNKHFARESIKEGKPTKKATIKSTKPKPKKFKPLNKHSLLKSNQYYKVKTKKTKICLHHTSGGTAKSSIDWWNKKPDHIATAVMIPRSGGVWELFNPQYWAYALGKTNYGTWLEKATIQFEIANWGGLIKVGSRYYTWSSKQIPANKVITYKKKHRGFKHFEKYTPKQIADIVNAIEYYAKKYNITINPKQLEKFWWGKQKPKALYSHTTVRQDKSDIHPQPELIKAIYDRFGCTAKVTE